MKRFNVIRRKTYLDAYSEGMAAGRKAGEAIGRAEAQRELIERLDEISKDYFRRAREIDGLNQGLRARISELEAQLAGADERARLLLDAKNRWADRAIEAEVKAQQSSNQKKA